MNERTLAICIATYQRPALVRRLLKSLAACQQPEGFAVQVRVVDNAPSANSQLLADDMPVRAGWQYELRHEPVQGIARARNAAVDIGPAEYFLFIDDDEQPQSDWLVRLVEAGERTLADGIVGAVHGICPPGAPSWMIRGGFFDKPTAEVGASMHWRGGRTSNTLIRGEWFGRHGLRFNDAFGLSGGEDTELFLQIAIRGGCFAGDPTILVYEDVEPGRATVRWLWRRHVRGGRNYYRLQASVQQARRQMVLLPLRLVRGALAVLLGLIPAAAGRPEHLMRGVFSLAVVWGSFQAICWPATASAAREYIGRQIQSV
jgi:succinoglycan biosynthesis protein ExoM